MPITPAITIPDVFKDATVSADIFTGDHDRFTALATLSNAEVRDNREMDYKSFSYSANVTVYYLPDHTREHINIKVTDDAS